jgi:NTP pyrophosphatase (non-canonical NTP hydrolase)
LTFNEYQAEAAKTATGLATSTFWYPALGLAGEAGEVAEKIKKFYRDDASLDAVVKELGDVLWYMAAIARNLNISLDDVARLNLEKITSRKERGKIHGEGDDR